MSCIEIKLLSKLSGFAGIRYPEPENYSKWRKPLRFLWNLYADVIQVAIMIQVSFLIVRMSKDINDLGIVCACLVGFGYPLHLVLKLIIFRKHKDLFCRIFDEMRKISKELCKNKFDGGYEEFYNDFYTKIIKISMIKGGFEVIAVTSLISIFIIKSYVVGVPTDSITPSMSWTPYDKTKNPAYSLSCLFELVVYGSVTLRNAVVDLLFLLMLIVPTIQLRYLYRLLEIIMNIASEKEEKELAGIHEDEINKWRNELNDNFIWWVKYHQRVLSLIQEFKTISSPLLGVSYLTTLIILSLAGLVAISTTSWNIFQQAIINGIVISNTIQLYFLSLAGDWVSESSERAEEGGFTGLLFRADKSLRKDYLFVCSRTKHPLQIRFGGINRLCSENFEQLIRLTMTYLVTIVQLRNEDNQKGRI